MKRKLLVLLSLLFVANVHAEEMFTGELMLSLYDQLNIDFSYDVPYIAGSRADVVGVFVGTTTYESFQSRRLGTVIVQSVYPQEVNLDRIEISIGLRGNSYSNDASRIEYTNSTSEGWVTLVNNIDFDAVTTVANATNLYLNEDFFVDTVSGLRWVMPADNWVTNVATIREFGDPLTPQLYRLNAYGTNTVPVDEKLNLVNAKAVSMTTNGPWSSEFTTDFDGIGDQIGYVSAASGYTDVDTNAYFQIEFDRRYNFKNFIVHWGKFRDVPRSVYTYDISVSEDGVNWELVADDHSVSNSKATHDDTSMDVDGKYIRIDDFNGYYSFTKNIYICELQAYGDPLPDFGTVFLIQ